MDASHIYESDVTGMFDTIRRPDNISKDFIHRVPRELEGACHEGFDGRPEGGHLRRPPGPRRDDGEALDPSHVEDGIQRELDIMRDLDFGEPVKGDESR
eukprot:8876786-Pyramimonas_sp.AAC.1